jgi:hypothetical protein
MLGFKGLITSLCFLLFSANAACSRQLLYCLYQVTGYEGNSVGWWVNAVTAESRKYSMEIV